MHGKLRETAEEERSIREQLNELKQQEEEDNIRYNELQERLQIEQQEHKNALQSKDMKIIRLKQQIEQLVSRTATERLAFETKMREEAEMAEKLFKNTEKELLKQLETAQTSLEIDGAENFHTEMSYHRRKNLRAQEVTQLIERYDNDMTFKHDSYVDLSQVYDRERTELQHLSGYFTRVDAFHTDIAQQHQLINERRNEELIQHRAKQEAALMIQTLYQPYYNKYGPKPPKQKKSKKKKKAPAKTKEQPEDGVAAPNAPTSGSAAPTARSGAPTIAPTVAETTGDGSAGGASAPVGGDGPSGADDDAAYDGADDGADHDDDDDEAGDN